MDPMIPSESPPEPPRPEIPSEAGKTSSEFKRTPPDLLETLEAGLRSLLLPGRVFALYAEVPCPGYSKLVPAVVIWFWEFLNPFMPAVLKKVSVIFYLDSLLPVALPPSPFSVVAEPVPAWLAVPGFFLFTAATLVVAGLRIRHMEIAYTAD